MGTKLFNSPHSTNTYLIVKLFQIFIKNISSVFSMLLIAFIICKSDLAISQDCPPNSGNLISNPQFRDVNKDNTYIPTKLTTITFKNNSNNEHDSKSIDLECSQNGNIQIELIDLLGNYVMRKELEKNSYKLIIPIDAKLTSGVFFIRVYLDGSLLYYNKINIVK